MKGMYQPSLQHVQLYPPLGQRTDQQGTKAVEDLCSAPWGHTEPLFVQQASFPWAPACFLTAATSSPLPSLAQLPRPQISQSKLVLDLHIWVSHQNFKATVRMWMSVWVIKISKKVLTTPVNPLAPPSVYLKNPFHWRLKNRHILECNSTQVLNPRC